MFKRPYWKKSVKKHQLKHLEGIKSLNHNMFFQLTIYNGGSTKKSFNQPPYWKMAVK